VGVEGVRWGGTDLPRKQEDKRAMFRHRFLVSREQKRCKQVKKFKIERKISLGPGKQSNGNRGTGFSKKEGKIRHIENGSQDRGKAGIVVISPSSPDEKEYRPDSCRPDAKERTREIYARPKTS